MRSVYRVVGGVLLLALASGCPGKSPTSTKPITVGGGNGAGASARPSFEAIGRSPAPVTETPTPLASAGASPSGSTAPSPSTSPSNKPASIKPVSPSPTPTGSPVPSPNGLAVSTYAGSTAGFNDAKGASAKFDQPNGLDVDNAGNLYVADSNNNRIRMVATDGTVTTVAGTGTAGFANGTPLTSTFNSPYGVAVSGDGTLYVADTKNNCIRKITTLSGVTTFAGDPNGNPGSNDGQGTLAQFNQPFSVALDAQDNLYVADAGNHRIRKITSGGLVSTLAGSSGGSTDGPISSATFRVPNDVAVDNAGRVFVADFGNNAVRLIDPSSNQVSTLAGGSGSGHADGQGQAASFDSPTGVAVDNFGNVYVADSANHLIRKITSGGLVSTLAGHVQGFLDGPALQADFFNPADVVVNNNGAIFVVDSNNNRIRRITSGS